MRAVFVGASSLTVATVRQLLGNGHEVVVIERDEERIEELKDYLDCGFIEGDGTRPAVLKQADPHNTDFLFVSVTRTRTISSRRWSAAPWTSGALFPKSRTPILKESARNLDWTTPCCPIVRSRAR